MKDALLELAMILLKEKGLRVIDGLIVLGLLVFIGILSIPGVNWLIDRLFQEQHQKKEQQTLWKSSLPFLS